MIVAFVVGVRHIAAVANLVAACTIAGTPSNTEDDLTTETFDVNLAHMHHNHDDYHSFFVLAVAPNNLIAHILDIDYTHHDHNNIHLFPTFVVAYYMLLGRQLVVLANSDDYCLKNMIEHQLSYNQ